VNDSVMYTVDGEGKYPYSLVLVMLPYAAVLYVLMSCQHLWNIGNKGYETGCRVAFLKKQPRLELLGTLTLT